MIKLKIKNINKNNYNLIDLNNKEYSLNFEFYGSEYLPKVNDTIYLNRNLLDKNNMLLYFGPLNDLCGKLIINSNHDDLLIIETNSKKFYLKRIYG